MYICINNYIIIKYTNHCLVNCNILEYSNTDYEIYFEYFFYIYYIMYITYNNIYLHNITIKMIYLKYDMQYINMFH